MGEALTVAPGVARLEGGDVLAAEAGVDWLTVTANTGGSRWRFRMLGTAVLSQEEMAGNERSQQSSRWYSWQRCGSFALGERADDTCAQMSGSVAARHWKLFAAAATSCSRLDLQVTIAPTRPCPGHAVEARDRVLDAPRRRGRPVEGRLVQGLRRGVTLYLGSPKSEQLARLYDKGAELDDRADGELWRYEVQYRDDAARAALAELRKYQTPEEAISEVVHAHFTDRGVPCLWEPGTHRCGSLQRERPPSDDQRKLAWLEASVAPTVAYLRQRGLEREVLTRLGLVGTVVPERMKHGGTQIPPTER